MITDLLTYECPMCRSRTRGYLPAAAVVLIGPTARLHICHCGITRRFVGASLLTGFVTIE